MTHVKGNSTSALAAVCLGVVPDGCRPVKRSTRRSNRLTACVSGDMDFLNLARTVASSNKPNPSNKFLLVGIWIILSFF